MNISHTKFLTGLAVTTSMLAWCSPAYAQIEEITVTARKRAESLQNVPASVAAFTGEQLKEAGVQSITDVQELTPNLIIQENSSLNSGVLSMAIRGIGNEPGFDAGVGLYVDDVYIEVASGALLDVYDVERIEVLKGPQGNLYGRNTIGGAVKYISREPGEESRANIELTVGTDDLVKVRGGVSGQVAENWFVGLGLSLTGREGYQTNEFDGQKFASEKKFAARGTAVWKPNDDLKVKFVADKTRDDSNPILPVRTASQLEGGGGLGTFGFLLGGADNFTQSPSSYLSGPGRALLAGQAGINTGISADVDSVDTEFTTEGFNKYFIETNSIAATVDYRLNDNWSLKSVSAVRAVDNSPNFEFDGSSQKVITVHQDRKQKSFTQELQANYTSDTLNAVGGLYYLDSSRRITNLTVQTPLIRLLSTQVKNTYFDDQPVESFSVYGNVDWDISDTLQLSVGGRYTKDEKTIKQLADVTVTNHVAALLQLDPRPGQDPVPLVIDPARSAELEALPNFVSFLPHTANGGVCDAGNGVFSGCLNLGRAGFTANETTDTFTENKDGSGSWSEFSPSVKLSWQASPDMLAYAGFASGFKAGGFDTQGGSPIAASYDPETVNTYSAGVKSTWADGTLRINGEVFFNDYTEKQLQTIAFVNNELVATTGNVGEVESKGFEVETTWQPVENFVLNANLGYLDADIKNYAETQNINGIDTVVNVANNFELGFSPEWTGQLRGLYTYNLANDAELIFGGSAAYRSELYTASPIDITDAFKATQKSDDYTTYNASVSYRPAGGHWRMGLEGRNLTDERILTNTFNVSNYISGGFTRGRTYAATLAYDF